MFILATVGHLRFRPANLPCSKACINSIEGSRCQEICTSLSTGGTFPAIGQRFLNGDLNGQWRIRHASLVRVEAPACSSAISDAVEMCDGCSKVSPTGELWNFSEAIGNVVIVKLNHCDVNRQGLLLGSFGARGIVTISRFSDNKLLGMHSLCGSRCVNDSNHQWRMHAGFYSKVAIHFWGAVSSVGGAPVVMVDQTLGEVLLRVTSHLRFSTRE